MAPVSPGPPDLPGGDGGGGQHRVLHGDAEGHGIAHAVVQIGGASGDGAIGQTGHAAGEEHRLPAQRVLPVRHAAAAQGVGNQADAAGEQLEGHPHGAGVDVVPVTDQLGGDALPLGGRADRTGIPVVNTGHGVIKVRQVGSARVKNGGSLLIGGVGVGHGDGTFFRCAAGEFHRAGQLRGHIRDPQQALCRVVEPGKGVVVRQTEIGGVLGALFPLGEERALHLDAQQPGTARRGVPVQAHRRAERRFQRVVGQGHGGGSEGRDAVLRQIGGHFHKAVIVAVGEVRAGAAVGVDIHQTGDDPRTAQVDARLLCPAGQHMGEAPVLHGEAAGDKPPVHKDQTVFKPHITPPAGPSARRAVPCGTVADQRHIGVEL